jgi:hypothetical protein
LPNKITRTVRVSFEEAFRSLNLDPDQPYALVNWAKKNPTEFYRLASKLIPVQVAATVDDVTELDATQRAARLAAMTARLEARQAAVGQVIEGTVVSVVEDLA